jgi:hypothetical protein
MSKPVLARDRTTTWSADNAALRRRGSLWVWLDREREGLAPASGRPGRSRTFSEAALQVRLGLKVLFGRALRRTIGMVARLLGRAGLENGPGERAWRTGLEDGPVPDSSTPRRRQSETGPWPRGARASLPNRRPPDPLSALGRPLSLLVDSPGVTMRGDGEWPVRRHGASRRRQWRKVHLAMDAATGDIRAVEFTPSREGDSPVLPDLLDQIPRDEQIGTVTADGAFDTRRCHTAIIDRGATAIIPIRRNGRPWKEDGPAARARNEILRASRHFGRALWKRLTGYHVRSRIEAQMRRLKAFGERIASRDPDRQTAEIHTRIALMNRFSALGQAEIVRVA